MKLKLFVVVVAFALVSDRYVTAQLPDDKQLITKTNLDSSDTSALKVFSSATVLTLSGLNFNLYNSMPGKFNGMFAKPPYTMVQIKYPASISNTSITRGVEMLDAALRSTPGRKIVMGHSQGAQVCSRWMREHAGDTTAPGAGELMFILTGNPLRATGGYIIGRKEVGGTTGLPTPTDTPWRIIDFARRYDGWADWVQDEQNKLAVSNANRGKQSLHKKYNDIDFLSSTHTTWSIGNTTFVLTREEQLPVLGNKMKSPGEIKITRAKIEAAYTNRPANDKP